MGTHNDFMACFFRQDLPGVEEEEEETVTRSADEDKYLEPPHLAESLREGGGASAPGSPTWRIAQSLLEIGKLVLNLARLVSLIRRPPSPSLLSRVGDLRSLALSVASALKQNEDRLAPSPSRALGEGFWSTPRAREAHTSEQLVGLGCQILHDLLREQEAVLHVRIAQAVDAGGLGKKEARTLGAAIGDVILILGRQARRAPKL